MVGRQGIHRTVQQDTASVKSWLVVLAGGGGGAVRPGHAAFAAAGPWSTGQAGKRCNDHVCRETSGRERWLIAHSHRPGWYLEGDRLGRDFGNQ